MSGRKLRAGGALLAAAALAACGPEPKVHQPKMTLVKPDCYTVDPFKKLRFAKPRKDLPEKMRAFLGAWGGGAWDGHVCHDLYVLKVDKSGEAILFDAHGPGFGNDATAFTRRGAIGEDGRLRVRKGATTVEYWIEDGRLHGTRQIGTHVARIILSPKAKRKPRA